MIAIIHKIIPPASNQQNIISSINHQIIISTSINQNLIPAIVHQIFCLNLNIHNPFYFADVGDKKGEPGRESTEDSYEEISDHR